MSHSSKDIFFIIGRGRSGTDLLQRLLNTNSNICIPPESSVIALLYNKYHKIKNWEEHDIKNFKNDVFLDDKISKWWGIKKRELRTFLLSSYPGNYRQAVIKLYQFYSNSLDKKKVLLGDKNPSNSLYIKEILSVFPNAKFIYLVRNPLDNVFSFTNVDFDSDNPQILAHRWNYYNDEILKWKNQFPEKFHQLKFESLIENTTGSLSKIAHFLNVEGGFDIENKEKGNQKWQENLSRNISKTHINKGKSNLSSANINYINSVCNSTAKKLGYELEGLEKNISNPKAWIFNRLEKHFIRLPLYLSSSILKYYRRKKNIIVDS